MYGARRVQFCRPSCVHRTVDRVKPLTSAADGLGVLGGAATVGAPATAMAGDDVGEALLADNEDIGWT
jgi:hypothetical protein